MKNMGIIAFISILWGAVSCSENNPADETVEYLPVAWELNGGAWPAGDNHATRVAKGGTLAEPAAPVKAGSTFDGWYKEVALTSKVTFPYEAGGITGSFTLYAKWTAGGGGGDSAGYQMFTSIADMKAWLDKQYNPEKTPYKVGLRGVNLDAGNNWRDLGNAVNSNKAIYVDLDVSGCSGTAMPDGYKEGNTTYGVFVDCDQLESVHFQEGLRSVGKYAFYQCDNLTSVTLREGLRSVGELAFGWCIHLEGIDLPAGFQYIDRSAFSSCSKLKYATLPAGLLIIGNDAFWGCNSLESIRIPEGVSISDNVFYSCESLASVTLPEGISNIENWFDFCESLGSITIPSSVTNINAGVFYTVPLDEIIMLSAIPPSLGTNVFRLKDVFDPASVSVTIKVPAVSLDTYKTAGGWSVYADKIVANTN